MKNAFRLFSVIALMAVIGFSFAACGDADDGSIPPEDKPVQDRWGKWVADDATATLDYSVGDDGVCTITVGGIAQTNNEADGWYRWKANASYAYTAKAGKSYVYTFEAWTESGTRELTLQYNTDVDNGIYLFDGQISLTTERKTYTVYGQPLSKGVLNQVEFQCADQLGTFYVKMLEIKEYTLGKLTITNFAGNPGLVQVREVYGFIEIDANSYIFIGVSIKPDGSEWGNQWNYTYYPIEGDTINIPVWLVDQDKKTVTPYKGNITVQEGSLFFDQWNPSDGSTEYFTNTVPITFTNGSAAINFGTQMQDSDSYVSPDNDRIDIAITGLPTTADGFFAMISLWQNENAVAPVAISSALRVISGNTVTGTMVNSGKNFDKEGNYFIRLEVYSENYLETLDLRLYVGTTTRNQAIVKGVNVISATIFSPPISMDAFQVPTATSIFGTYTGQGYTAGVVETIELTQRSFRISDDSSPGNTAFLSFRIDKWEEIPSTDLPSDAASGGYTNGIRITGKIIEASPNGYIPSTQTAPGFTMADVNAAGGGPDCWMSIYFKGTGASFTFIRSPFSKAGTVNGGIAGSNGTPRVYTKSN